MKNFFHRFLRWLVGTSAELEEDQLPVWDPQNRFAYKYPHVFCRNHQWFVFTSKLVIPDAVLGHDHVSEYQDRICEKCFLWQTRPASTRGVFMQQGHGRDGYYKLLKMKRRKKEDKEVINHIV